MATRQRRDRGDGSIYQRESDGLYVAYARVEDASGQRKRKYVYDKTRSGVQKKLKDLQRSIEQRTVITAKPETVEAFLLYWLSVRKGRKDIKASTVNTQSYHLQAVYAHIGQVKLARLNGGQLQTMCNALLETHKASTVHAVVLILSAAFHDAIRWKKLHYNPCKDVQLPAPEKHEGVVLTPEQALALLTAVKGNPLECWLTVALATGMRRGELLALHWADIDFEAKTLKVRGTASYLPGPNGEKRRMVEGTPKSKSSRRTIKLAQFAINALKEHRTKQLEQRLLAGAAWNDLGLIFCNKTGAYYGLATLGRHFKKLLNGAGLPDMRIHDLRHSAATLLLSMGVSLKVVQEILGHSNYTLTANIYGHVLMGMQEEAMDKMDGLFLSAK